MKIINVIYGIWYIQYSVHLKYDFNPFKIVRIENKTQNCCKLIHTNKTIYLKTPNLALHHRNITKDILLDGFIEGVD